MSVIVNDKQIVKIDTHDINVLKQALDSYAMEMWDSYQEYLKKGKERKSHRDKYERALRLRNNIDKIFNTEWQCLLKQG